MTTTPYPETREAYAHAVRYCVDHPERLDCLWQNPQHHPAGCLFQFVTPTGRAVCDNGRSVGCVTQIVFDDKEGFTDELTDLIRQMHIDPAVSDYGFPNIGKTGKATPEQLEALAAAQRAVDRVLDRDTPKWPDEGIENWEREQPGKQWRIEGGEYEYFGPVSRY